MCDQPITMVGTIGTIDGEAIKSDGNSLPKRFPCPLCKRRLKVYTKPCDDGCCLNGYIPKHKKKRWWKK